MLGYYFKIWQNIEKDERGSIWRRFATNVPFFAKAFLIVLILCLLGFVVSTLLPSDFAFTVQIAILAFTLVLSFFYSILLNKFKRKSALGDLGCCPNRSDSRRPRFHARRGPAVPVGPARGAQDVHRSRVCSAGGGSICIFLGEACRFVWRLLQHELRNDSFRNSRVRDDRPHVSSWPLVGFGGPEK